MNKSDAPLISIITPVYKAEKYLGETIRSVKEQTYQNWELLLVNDQSPDNSRDLIISFAENDPRIRLIDLEENSGAAVARNTAINAAKGRYLAFLDSDDQWHPDKLEKQLEFMQKNDISFSFTGYEIIEQDGSKTGKIVQVPEKINYNQLLRNTIIGCLTVMLDRDKIQRVQMVNIRTRQDLVLWLDILKQGHIAYGINESLAYYRKVEGSISSNKLKAAKQNWKVYRNIEKLSLPKALMAFAGYAYNGYKKN
jgi:teichuronic acid biosynthesis glycosyltransferase TuaG